MNVKDYINIIIKLQPVVKQVGELLVESWQQMQADPKPEIGQKADQTPVVAADVMANQALMTGLQRTWPHIPIISEEMDAADYTMRMQWELFWLIDPLDGTKGFINGNNSFSVNIALIHHGVAVLGVLYDPYKKQFYYAADELGAYQLDLSQQDTAGISLDGAKRLAARKFDPQQITIVVGEGSFNDNTRVVRKARAEQWQVKAINSALKLSFLAAGGADFYARAGQIYEWDIAAGQCILEQAGGVIVDFQRRPLRYNAADSLSLPPFVAISDYTAVDEIFNLLQGVYDNDS